MYVYIYITVIFYLPQNLNVFDEVEKNIEIGGQQNSLFPNCKGPVIKKGFFHDVRCQRFCQC